MDYPEETNFIDDAILEEARTCANCSIFMGLLVLAVMAILIGAVFLVRSWV